MSSKFTLVATVNDNAAGVLSHLLPSRGSPAMLLDAIARYFDKMAGGMVSSSTILQTTGVAATGSVAFSSVVQDDTVTVGATVFTGKDSPSGTSQFLTGSTDAASATSLAVAINANATTSKYVSASANSATVTITSLIPGVVGNAIILARSAHATVTAFASGTNDTNVTIGHGI